eukprot:7234650-Prymnesium_polylepis.1
MRGALTAIVAETIVASCRLVLVAPQLPPLILEGPYLGRYGLAARRAALHELCARAASDEVPA